MKKLLKFRILTILAIFVSISFCIKPSMSLGNSKVNSSEVFSIQKIPQAVKNKIVGYSWTPKAPVILEDLRYLKLTYWGFDSKKHVGELIVNKSVSDEVVEIFKDLFKVKFPIEKMRLTDEYQGVDEKSMEDNNTSAFCFRRIEGSASISKHSYGLGIDINPLINPYVKNNKVLPITAKKYLNRNKLTMGIITKNDTCYNLFVKRGWKWGGDWKSLKDYQHFEK